jgi:hypothetical protein
MLEVETSCLHLVLPAFYFATISASGSSYHLASVFFWAKLKNPGIHTVTENNKLDTVMTDEMLELVIGYEPMFLLG